jgi:acyl-CoA reductase-like NAD-dependent aldehyde dehydrogenase
VKTYGNYIGGNWVDAGSGEVFENADPATCDALARFPRSGHRNRHREAGKAALDFYTDWKALYVDCSGRLQRAQIDNA